MNKNVLCDSCEKIENCQFEADFRRAYELVDKGNPKEDVVEEVFKCTIPDCGFVCRCNRCRKNRELLAELQAKIQPDVDELKRVIAEDLGVELEDIGIGLAILSSPFSGVPVMVELEMRFSNRASEAMNRKWEELDGDAEENGEIRRFREGLNAGLRDPLDVLNELGYGDLKEASDDATMIDPESLAASDMVSEGGCVVPPAGDP